MARGWVRSAHDVSDGGLAVTLPEMAFGGGLGFRVALDATGLDGPGVALVSEGSSRWVVEVPAEATGEFERAFRGLPVRALGEVTDGGGEFRWRGTSLTTLHLSELYGRWRAGLDGLGRR